MVLDGTEQRFPDCISREVAWNVDHQPDATFLAGVPDIRERLPQA